MYKFNKETLDFEKVNVNLLGTKIALVSLAVAVVTGFAVAPRASIRNLTQEEKVILIREYNQFSKHQLIQKIKELNFKYPHIILAQATLESGHFKSTIFLENKNLFGMKEAFQRTTLAHGSNRGHAYYETWQDSVLDYALYYATYLSSIKTEGEYYEYLKQNYAEDPTYVQRLQRVVKEQNLKSKFN